MGLLAGLLVFLNQVPLISLVPLRVANADLLSFACWHCHIII